MKSKYTFYEIMIFVAYGFFLLLGLTWYVASAFSGDYANVLAVTMVAAFASQFYYRHRLTNLILGVLGLFFSIWNLLNSINAIDLLAKKGITDNFFTVSAWFCVLGIIMSGILMFSYTKLNFKDR